MLNRIFTVLFESVIPHPVIIKLSLLSISPLFVYKHADFEMTKFINSIRIYQNVLTILYLVVQHYHI